MTTRTVILVGLMAGHLDYAIRSFPIFVYPAAAMAFGLATGAAVGSVLRRLVTLRVPIAVLLFAMPLFGALWGAVVGALASVTTHALDSSFAAADIALSVCAAALVGAIQVGWFWLPYAGAVGRRRSLRGLHIAAAPLAIAAGLVAWYGWLYLAQAIASE